MPYSLNMRKNCVILKTFYYLLTIHLPEFDKKFPHKANNGVRQVKLQMELLKGQLLNHLMLMMSIDIVAVDVCMLNNVDYLSQI